MRMLDIAAAGACRFPASDDGPFAAVAPTFNQSAGATIANPDSLGHARLTVP
jgi:hypothetical protein